MSDNYGNSLDPYRVLGVSRSASEKQIRRAYLALAKSTTRTAVVTRHASIKSRKRGTNCLSLIPRQSRLQSRRARTRTSTKPGRTPEPVRFRPPLADGPVRTQTNPPVTVDSLLAQQLVHGSIPGGFFGRKQRSLHARLSEVLQSRVQSALPAVRIFHGVKLSRKLTLDTVLLGGTKVAVFAVQHTPPDVYQFNGSELVGRKRLELPDLTDAVAGLQKLS